VCAEEGGGGSLVNWQLPNSFSAPPPHSSDLTPTLPFKVPLAKALPAVAAAMEAHRSSVAVQAPALGYLFGIATAEANFVRCCIPRATTCCTPLAVRDPCCCQALYWQSRMHCAHRDHWPFTLPTQRALLSHVPLILSIMEGLKADPGVADNGIGCLANLSMFPSNVPALKRAGTDRVVRSVMARHKYLPGVVMRGQAILEDLE
jgi:hypothetical protein